MELQQNYNERQIMTIHHFGKDFQLIFSTWEWNNDLFQNFDLMFSGKVVGNWNYCPLYREMMEKIDDFLEGGN